MIVPMKKISILLPAQEKINFLQKMQEVGIVEISKAQERTTKALEEKTEYLGRVRRTIQDLKHHLIREKKKRKGKIPKSPPASALQAMDPEKILTEFDRLHEELTRITNELEKFIKDEEKIRPWGNFSYERIRLLESHGVKTRFYTAPESDFARINKDKVIIEKIKDNKKLVYFMAVLKEQDFIKADEVFLPQDSHENILRKIDEKTGEKTAKENELLNLCYYSGALEKYAKHLKNLVDFDQALLYCAEDEKGKLVTIDGWFQEADEKSLVAFLGKFQVRYTIAAPGPEDSPPVKLRNFFWVRPFELITRLFSLPSYTELDPTPLFAPFFALFFGLCVRDTGYAILVLLLFSGFYFKAGKEVRPVLNLGIILGLVTVLAGYWLNTFYGFSIFENEGVEESLLGYNVKGDFLASYVEGGKMHFPALSFSLVVGFAQLSLGILLNAVSLCKKKGFLYSLKPFSFWLLMAGAVIFGVHKNLLGMADLQVGGFLLGQWIHKIPYRAGLGVLGLGFTLLLLFVKPEKKIWVRPAIAFWELYEFVSAIMGDILSYLRLFALGLASGLLGEAVNFMAAMVMKPQIGDPHYSVMGIFWGVIIFLAGHSINILLAILGAFVHSLRLTFVEFYKNLKFEGGGKPFTPFMLEK